MDSFFAELTVWATATIIGKSFFYSIAVRNPESPRSGCPIISILTPFGPKRPTIILFSL